MDNLIKEINTTIKLKEEFSKYLGIPFEDIPEELINEAMGGALSLSSMGGERASMSRHGESEWRRELQGGNEEPNQAKTYRDPRQGGMPTTAVDDAEADAPNVGDFVVVNGKPVKIVDKKQMFGDSEFVYLKGVRKPVIADRLNLHKTVGKLKVFSIK